MRYQLLSVALAGLFLAACENGPDKAETKGTGFDNWPNPNAAGAGPVPGSADDFRKNVGDTVHFAFDRSDLNEEGKKTVDGQAAWLAKWPSVNVVVEGHCDERGTVEYNLALGARRANNVKKALTGKGVDAKRVDTVSFGKERPVAAGHDEASWAQNRRAVVVIR